MGSTSDEDGAFAEGLAASNLGEPGGLVAADSGGLVVVVGEEDISVVGIGVVGVAALPQARKNTRPLRGMNRAHWIILAFKVVPLLGLPTDFTGRTLHLVYGRCNSLDVLITNSRLCFNEGLQVCTKLYQIIKWRRPAQNGSLV